MSQQTGVSPDILPLPSGGGSVASIGDTFAADLFTGTGSYSVPLWFPSGPGGFKPKLSLDYSTTAGNQEFGMGWSLNSLKLWRQTDRGIPRYDNTDTLLLAGEKIVRLAGTDPNSPAYRAQKEVRFHRIHSEGDGFIVTDAMGLRYELGLTTSGREEQRATAQAIRTSAWLIEKAVDTCGNTIHYQWLRDGERLYLESISYGPYHIRFRYQPREDIQTNHRRGYTVSTALRCYEIQYRLQNTPGEDSLFRRYTLEYTQDPLSRLSMLSAITLKGEERSHGVLTEAQLPHLHFDYQAFDFAAHYQPYQADRNVAQPSPQENTDTQLVDLYAQGSPGVIQVDGPIRRYWPSASQGRFGKPRTLKPVSSRLNLSDQPVAFADMDGTGTADALLLAESPLGYIKNHGGAGLDSQRSPLAQAPSFDIFDGELRLVDLDGDGRVDAIRSSANYFYLYRNRGNTWLAPIAIARIRDMAVFPDINFSDPRVQFADMTGDGLMDVLWIHGSRIDYWPGLGGGRFGHRRQLSLQPSLAQKNLGNHFDINRLFLADINGDGITDIVYVNGNHIQAWINQSGNALAYAGTIRHTPLSDGRNIRVADMEGLGIAGIQWSYPHGQVSGGNYKFLSFSGGQRPYLLSKIDNGLGLHTRIHYQSSVQQARQAQEQNQAWEKELPFPLQVVASIEEIDTVSGAHSQRNMRYRNGLFDGKQRQFLGFDTVSVTEIGDSDTPSTETLSYFHQAQGELAGRLKGLEVWDLGITENREKPRLMRREHNQYQVKTLALSDQGEAIIFPHLSTSLVENLEGQHIEEQHLDRQGSGQFIRTDLSYDNAGNLIQRQQEWSSGNSSQRKTGQFRYSAEVAGQQITALPIEYREQDSSGQVLRLKRYYYDGNDFQGLPLGQVTRGKLARIEQLVFSKDQFNHVYQGLGLVASDYGYHAIDLGNGSQGWATHTLRQAYDQRGNIKARQDALGNIGQIEYEAFGIAPTKVTDPIGLHYQGEYDYRAAQLRSVSDPNQQTTAYRFDPVGRLIAVIKPGDSDTHPTEVIRFNHSAVPLSITTELRENSGSAASIKAVDYIDGRGEVIQRRAQAEAGQVIVDGWRRYNRRGWEAQRSIPFFSTGMDYIPGEGASVAQQFRFRYDGLGRVTETYTPDGHWSRSVYAVGQLTRYDVSDTDNSPANIARGHYDTPRTETMDAKGDLLSVVEMNADRSLIRTHYRRDPLGQLLGINDARGIDTADYHHDLLGRKIRVDHRDAGTRRRLYNARGDLAAHFDAHNRPVHIHYDAVGRKTAVWVEGIREEHYRYDSGSGQHIAGRLAEVSDAAGTVEFSYTPRGLVERKQRTMPTLNPGGDETFTLHYHYDAMERPTQIVRPDNSPIDYRYNPRGLDSIPGSVQGITRNALGQITQVTLANGTREHYRFDPDNFYLSELQVDDGTTNPLLHLHYSHDAAGNPLSIQDTLHAVGHTHFNRQFRYDALSRLTGMNGQYDGNDIDLHYAYDAAGNFQQNNAIATGELYLAPGGSNHLRGVRSANGDIALFHHDSNGAMVQSPGRQCEFDARGRLLRVTMASGSVVTYQYAYDGARIRKRITKPGATLQENLYIDEYFERIDNRETRWVLAEGRRIAASTATEGTQYLHQDHLGSVVLVTDSSGAKVSELGYRPFGGTLYRSGAHDNSKRGFIGCEQDDETQLVYCAARYYDPRLGRFISPDPYLLYEPERSLHLPANLNLYTYAANNPIRQVDNAGTFWKWIVGALVIVALVVATVVVGVLTGGAGFAFGILLAATIGSALGAGIGVSSAAMAGGSGEDLANGFLFGALIGGAAGAAGYAAGAAVGAIGISTVWGSILAGAAQGAIIGAGNGAVIGYAGGTGSVEDVFLQMGIGFLVGAVTGGLAGWLSTNPSVVGNGIEQGLKTGTATAIDPVTGATISQTYSTGLDSIAAVAGNYSTKLISHIAHPIAFASFGSINHLVIHYYWDDISSWLLETFGGEEEEIIISVPVG